MGEAPSDSLMGDMETSALWESARTPEEMLGQFIGGDEQAFHDLVDAVGGRLFGFICRFLGDHHLAEDVYQTVLVKVATHARSYDGRARFTTWMYQIARNACLDAVRSRARRKVVSLDAEAGDCDSSLLEAQMVSDLPPAEQLTVAELGARISTAVEALPPEQKEVFLLRENADLTFEEIGEILGCGKETAKSRMRYALKRLQNALSAEARLYGLLNGL